jgi:hypothetical protein
LYEIDSRQKFLIKGCTAGTGGACGGILLSRRFEEFLKQLLRDGEQEISEMSLKVAMNTFEGNIKINFNPFENDCEEVFEVPITGVRDYPHIGLENGVLKLSKHDIPLSLCLIFQEGFVGKCLYSHL